MTENPEQVLPQQRIGTRRDIKELGTEVALKREQEQRDSNNWNCKQQQELHDRDHPCEDRHLHQRHAGRSHVENRDDQVDRAGQRRNTRYLQTECPKVDTVRWRKDWTRVWRIHEPAAVGCSAQEPRQV